VALGWIFRVQGKSGSQNRFADRGGAFGDDCKAELDDVRGMLHPWTCGIDGASCLAVSKLLLISLM
jgi:hypothetical protein